VDSSQFLPTAQLRQWHEELDDMGLRATGSPIHEHYIDVLIARLQQAGVTQVHSEPVPVQRWTAGRWSLESAERSSEPIATSSYIPYSGSTPAGGVTGPLARVGPGTMPAPGSLAGKIAVLDVPSTPVTYSVMTDVAYARWDLDSILDPSAPYSRPWGGISDLISLLDTLPAAGAVGCIAIIDLPAEAARGPFRASS
jgi:hypothetical protein